jgi:hypothetical protein
MIAAAADVAAGSEPAQPSPEETSLFQQAHAWGRFTKGAWRQVRIVTENFDEHGKLANASTTDNTTTVQDASADQVVLKVEVTVEIAGKRLPSQPQVVKQGYAGENVGQSVSIKTLPAETLVVDGRTIRCEIRQVEIQGGASKEVSLIHYSPQVTPPILRRTSTISDAATAKTTQEVVSEVKALDMSLPVLEEIGFKTAYLVRQEQRNDRGRTMTWAWHVPDVPGEIVASSAKKFDAQGRLTRQTTLQLVAYGNGTDDPAAGAGNRRARRHRRPR